MAEEAPTIEIDGTTYKLDESPDTQSKVVEEEREDFIRNLSYDKLNEGLEDIYNYLSVLYRGAAAFPEKMDIQSKVRKVTNETTQLVEELSFAFDKFSRQSKYILDGCIESYKTLISGNEPQAFCILTTLEERANALSKEATRLQRKITELQDEIMKVICEVRTVKGEQLQQFDDSSCQLIDTNKRAQQSIHEYEVAAKKLKMDKFTHKKPLASVIQTIKTSPYYEALYEAGEVLLDHFAGKTTKELILWIFNKATGDNEDESKIEEAKAKYNVARQRHYKHCIETMKGVKQSLESMRGIQSSMDYAIEAAKLLHSVVGGLQELEYVMKLSSRFWKQMASYCDEKYGFIGRQATTLVGRNQDWMTDYWKKTAIREYAKWKALSDICSECFEKVKNTRDNLDALDRENLTVDEGREQMMKSARELVDEVEKKYKRLELECRQLEEEMRCEEIA